MTLAGDRKIDPDQVVALHAECGHELHRLALGVLRDPHLAADAVQSAFVKAIEQGGTAEESPRGWMFRVVLNEALAVKRRQGVHQRALDNLNWLAETGGLARSPMWPDEQACRREDIERVRTALESLPDEQRQLVRMRLFEQKTFTVIAEELHVPLGTVLWRMQAAVKKLRRKLAGQLDIGRNGGQAERQEGRLKRGDDQ